MKHALLALILALPVAAAVQIDMVYYDPYNEAGSEFVRLYNTAPEPVDLTGWTIATPTSPKDATLEGTIQGHGTFLVVDTGWDAGKDNASWPSGDYEETLSLPNTGGFVRIVDTQGTVHDTIGYGETTVSDGTPHPGAPEGQALIRHASTGDNANDFHVAIPTFDTPTSTAEDEATTELIIDIEEIPVTITTIVIDDDDEADGVQLIPLPGGTRDIPITVTIHDPNGVEDVTVHANGELLHTNDTGPHGTFTGSFPLTTTTTEVHVTATDAEHTATARIAVELLHVVGLAIQERLHVDMTPGEQRNATLHIENIGTTALDIQLKGTTPVRAGRILGDITYTLLGQQFTLEDAFRAHAIGLAPGSLAAIDLHINAGYVPAGSYTGQILIAGVAQ